MITASVVPVPPGSAVSLATVPGGYQAALSLTAGTVYIGDSTAVTATIGAPLSASYALLPRVPPTAAPSVLYAVAGTGGGTIPVGIFLSGPR